MTATLRLFQKENHAVISRPSGENYHYEGFDPAGSVFKKNAESRPGGYSRPAAKRWFTTELNITLTLSGGFVISEPICVNNVKKTEIPYVI